MEEKIRLAVFGQKRLSREGGIEIVVKELYDDIFLCGSAKQKCNIKIGRKSRSAGRSDR